MAGKSIRFSAAPSAFHFDSDVSWSARSVIKPTDGPWSIHVAFSSPIWALLFANGASARCSCSVRSVPRIQQVRATKVQSDRRSAICWGLYNRLTALDFPRKGEIFKSTLPWESVTFIFLLIARRLPASKTIFPARSGSKSRLNFPFRRAGARVAVPGLTYAQCMRSKRNHTHEYRNINHSNRHLAFADRSNLGFRVWCT